MNKKLPFSSNSSTPGSLCIRLLTPRYEQQGSRVLLHTLYT